VPEPLLDDRPRAAAAALLRAVGVADDVVAVEPLVAGAVGSVRRVRTAGGAAYVVKRYPAHLAHRARTESAALTVVRRLGVGCPVPRLLGHGADGQGPYLVTDLVPGVRLDSRSAAERAPVFAELGRLLRRLHDVAAPSTLPALSLDGVGAQYAARGGPHAARVAAALDGVTARGDRLCHGDLSDGNVLVVPDAGGWAVSGVVDWERAGAGDPLADLARTVFHAGFKDPGPPAAMLDGYRATRAERAAVRRYELALAAEAWSWFRSQEDDLRLRPVEAWLERRLAEPDAARPE
jgi:aminoglycoside phosphotransferase (APT) family kinase protein